MKGKKKKVAKKSKKVTSCNIKYYNRFTLYFIGILLILLLIIVGITFSYAFWNSTVTQKEQNTVESGCLSFSFNDKDVNNNVTNINLSNAYPISDDKGLSLVPYTFTITNTCNLTSAYNLYFHNLASSSIDSSYIKIALKNNGVLIDSYPIKVNNLNIATLDTSFTSSISGTIGTSKEDYILYSFDLDPEETINFSLSLWIDEVAPNDIMGEVFESAISVYAVPTN